MGKLFLPIILAVLGTGIGTGAGCFLRLAPSEEVAEQGGDVSKNMEKEDGYSSGTEFVKLNNQFVVPVVAGTLVEALVVISLSIEVPPGLSEKIYAKEPKLRDAMLQVLFDHANIGGFSGTFTNANTLDVLRAELTEVARSVISPDIANVLIVDLARQDV